MVTPKSELAIFSEKLTDFLDAKGDLSDNAQVPLRLRSGNDQMSLRVTLR
jgi:hypothetical protein